jgi:hypothetical protein
MVKSKWLRAWRVVGAGNKSSRAIQGAIPRLTPVFWGLTLPGLFLGYGYNGKDGWRWPARESRKSKHLPTFLFPQDAVMSL